ncbi:ThiF family adenylyltransferase [Geothrix sp.]
MLTPSFVRDRALFCRDEGFAYLAIHNHAGLDSVEFSGDDLRSHERGYPALRDITRGQIVGGLVFAQNAVAGDLWFKNGRKPLAGARVLGSTFRYLTSDPIAGGRGLDIKYDRQARLFGERGQGILRKQRVGIIGLGGIGSLVCELLSRLGVGSLVLVDPDRIEPSNLSRVVGSSAWDTREVFQQSGLPKWIKNMPFSRPRLKVDIASRVARQANSSIEVQRIPESVVDGDTAEALTSCDFIFLAADSHQARHVFNALVHQYLIPGVQLGAKVEVEAATGKVGRVFSVVRPSNPGSACLWCNGLISPAKLQDEALSATERIAQRYVDEPDIPSPSVITLNAVAAARGVDDYLFRTVGLRLGGLEHDFLYFEPRLGSIRFDAPRTDAECTECGASSGSRFAAGDGARLPVRPFRRR